MYKYLMAYQHLCKVQLPSGFTGWRWKDDKYKRSLHKKLQMPVLWHVRQFPIDETANVNLWHLAAIQTRANSFCCYFAKVR